MDTPDPASEKQENQSPETKPNNFDRKRYWKHITLSILMVPLVWPVLFLVPLIPFEIPSNGWAAGGAFFGGLFYLLSMLVYQWTTIVKRVANAKRSAILWVIGIILLPYINFFLLIRLGFITAPDDESTLDRSDKILATVWVVAFTLVFWAAQVTVWMFGYAEEFSTNYSSLLE